MSKPNSQNVGVSPGLCANDKIVEMRAKLRREIPRKIPFADTAPQLAFFLFAYASDQQTDGNFSSARYQSPEMQLIAIKRVCPWIDISEAEAVIIWRIYREVELIQKDKLLSWERFNAHVSKHEQHRRQREKAGKISAKLRAERLEAAKAAKAASNGHTPKPSPAPSPKMTATQEVSLIDKAIEEAKGKPEVLKVLKARRREVLGQATNSDLSTKSKKVNPNKPAPEAVELTDAELLEGALDLIKTGFEHLLTARQRELLEAANPLPA